MHPRIEELVEHLQTQREVVRSSFRRFPVDSQRQRPARGGWSATEVIEHLAIIEARVTSLLANVVAKARAEGFAAETETTSVLDPSLMKVFLDRTRRVETGDSGRPAGTMDAAGAWAALEATRLALLDALLAADGLALGELTRAHPVGQTLSMYDWFAFVGWHEARHAAQIDEIGRTLAAEAAAGVAVKEH